MNLRKELQDIIERIKGLEVKVDGLQKDMLEMKDNHLKTVYTKLESQDKWLISLMTAVILSLAGLITNLIIKGI